MFRFWIAGWEIASKHIPRQEINPVGFPLGLPLQGGGHDFILKAGFYEATTVKNTR
jgi:hypothetical protein